MLSAAPTPPPPAPTVRTDIRAIEPDDQWKADLRKRIEHDLLHMVEEAQIVRDVILNSQPSESGRERAQREYDESMNNIRTLAQNSFTRQLREEMSERKWALDSISSISPDVSRQQEWILANIRKSDKDRPFVPPNTSPNAKGALSASPQQQSDSEQGPDENSEDGYESGGQEDKEGGSNELGEIEDKGEDDNDGDDPKPRQSLPPSRSSVPLTQPLHSNSPASGRNSNSPQRQPPNFQLAEDNDDDEADDPRHPSWRGNQPYFSGGAPRRQTSSSQGSLWTVPRAPEPSGISRTFANANGQVLSTGLVSFPRRVPRSTLARQGNKLPQVHNPLAGDLWFVTTPEDPSPTTPQEVHE